MARRDPCLIRCCDSSTLPERNPCPCSRACSLPPVSLVLPVSAAIVALCQTNAKEFLASSPQGERVPGPTLDVDRCAAENGAALY